MNTPKARDILEKALKHLEDVVERKLSYLESENTKLKAEVVKLKSELKKISDTSLQKNLEPDIPLFESASTNLPHAHAPLVAQPPQQEILSDVHISLSKLKRLVS